MSSYKSSSIGVWTIDPGTGLATWLPGPYLRSSYNLTVPSTASAFSVATPSGTREFSLRTTLAQLVGVGTPSLFTGSTLSQDKLKVVDYSGTGGSINDSVFDRWTSVEKLELQSSVGFSVTLRSNAQGAGIRSVEGSDAADTLDASGYTSAIKLEGDCGDDMLIGGQGGDKLEGGKGADQVKLDFGGTDVVKYESRYDGSAMGVPSSGNSFAGFDTITGFTSSENANPDGDKIDIDYCAAAVEYIDGLVNFDFTNVDAVVAAMNTRISGALLVPGRSVIFAINDGATSALYSATVIDSNPGLPGVEAVANPFMLATVDAVLKPGDII